MTKNNSPRVALITGASRGIGAACARRLAADGLAVAINTSANPRSKAAAEAVVADIRRSGGQAATYVADISDAQAVGTMFEQCEAELGPVYALVLNAAATARHHWGEITEAEWDRISAVNLKGAFLCSQRAFGRADSPNEGVVITVSSIWAKTGSPHSLHYATTKAGLLGFTRSLARELGPRGVRVNCLMPGAIQTEEELESFPDQEAVSRLVFDRQALQRRGLAGDVAGVLSFLVSDDSSFMTGQTLCVDGGWVMF